MTPEEFEDRIIPREEAKKMVGKFYKNPCCFRGPLGESRDPELVPDEERWTRYCYIREVREGSEAVVAYFEVDSQKNPDISPGMLTTLWGSVEEISEEEFWSEFDNMCRRTKELFREEIMPKHS